MCPLGSTPISSPARAALWVPNQGPEESSSRGSSLQRGLGLLLRNPLRVSHWWSLTTLGLAHSQWRGLSPGALGGSECGSGWEP